jgi:hypothetical protein
VTDRRNPFGPTPDEPSARTEWRRVTANFTPHKGVLDASRRNAPIEQGIEMEL